VVPALQESSKAKTSVGVEMNHESIYILNIITDEDGNLKIKNSAEFTDSKAELDFFQAMAAAGAGVKK
jgi:hypothetical protein